MVKGKVIDMFSGAVIAPGITVDGDQQLQDRLQEHVPSHVTEMLLGSFVLSASLVDESEPKQQM